MYYTIKRKWTIHNFKNSLNLTLKNLKYVIVCLLTPHTQVYESLPRKNLIIFQTRKQGSDSFAYFTIFSF